MAHNMGNCCSKNDVIDVPSFPDWMSQLPEKLQEIPLNQIAIPGSHDTTSFYLNEHAILGPDLDPALKEACKFLPGARKVVCNWSVAQSLKYTQQLEAGVRYFDVRVSTYPGTEDLYLVHGMYSHKLEDMLKAIDTYLTEHSKEIVLLDLNHFYGMTVDHHKYCLNRLMEIFGDKLCPYLDIDSVNLTTMWENKLQVIVFYRDPSAEENFLFWPGSKIPSPWPNVTDPVMLIKILEKNFDQRRDRSTFYVTQGVLTPSKTVIFEHIFSSLKSELSVKCDKEFTKWLGTKRAGINGINICIMDFVELNNYIPILMGLNAELNAQLTESL